MRLRQRLIVLLAITVVLGLVSAIALITALNARDDAIDEQRSAAVALSQVTGLRAAFSDQQVAQRSYRVTGDRSFLDSYERGRGDAEALFRNPELDRLDVEVRMMLDDVEKAWQQWQDRASDPQIEARAAGDAAGVERLEPRFASLFGDLQARLEGLEPAVTGQLDDAEARVVDLARVRDLILVLAFVALALVTVTGAILLRRWVTVPIARIGDAARRVAAGDRSATIPAAGPPDLSRLGADVEGMRRSLNQALLGAVKAREAVEGSAAVLIGLRSELEPAVLELPGEWTVAARVQPAEGVVAGDCYDIVRISDALLGIVVVDVSGHGAMSGITALRCRELLRAALRDRLDPGPAVRWACERLDDLEDEVFLSACVAVVDLQTGEVRYANAGHPPPFLCGQDAVDELPPTGPIVGPIEAAWETERCRVEPGDTLVIYTDGVVEARREDDEEYGIERLTDLVCGLTCDEASAIAKQALDEVGAFAPGRLRDDATIMLLCRGPRETRPRPLA